MNAANRRRARVNGAGIAVVTVQSGSAFASSVVAEVAGGACISILTWRRVVEMDAPCLRVTAIVGAWIAIVTIEWCSQCTDA